VRKPSAALALVHAELFQAGLDARGERRRATGRIGEDEHADRARLAVARDLEREGLGRGSLACEQSEDGIEDGAGLRPEERERDVVGGDGAACSEMARGPPRELGSDVVGQLESEKEPEPGISRDGSRSAHAGV
jgi:hypothetical protein